MTALRELILDTLEAQADVFTMDEMADHIERAILDAAGGPTHRVQIKGAAWTIQHPIHERFEGTLFGCKFADWVADDPGIRADGQYRVTLREDGRLDWGYVING